MKEWTSSMSIEETRKILEEARTLKKLGKNEEAEELQLKIPLDPGYADDIKRLEGIQFLIDGGFNLTDAINKFGENLLHA